MLVLTRRLAEGIVIVGNKDVHIVIMDIRSNTVKIGIKAPDECRVLRNELYSKEKIDVSYGKNNVSN